MKMRCILYANTTAETTLTDFPPTLLLIVLIIMLARELDTYLKILTITREWKREGRTERRSGNMDHSREEFLFHSATWRTYLSLWKRA